MCPPKKGNVIIKIMMWQWKVLEITKGIIFVKMKDLWPFIIIMIGSLETLLIFLSSLSDLGSTQANRRRGGLPLEPVDAIFMTIDTNSEMPFFIPPPTTHTYPDMYKVKGQNHRLRQFLGGSIPLSVRHKHNSCLLFAPAGSSGHQRTQWI